MRAINNTVKTAVAMIAPAGKTMLAAFISSQSGFGPEFSHEFSSAPADKTSVGRLGWQMSDQLTKQLPSYMIPSVFLPLAYMPLTASGKTDRRLIASFGDSLTLNGLAAAAGNVTTTERRDA